MNLGQRLSRLEIIYQPVDHAAMDDDARRWYLGLCDPSIVTTIQRFAGYLAERRYHHASGSRQPWAGDWLITTTEPERDTRVQAELDRLSATTPSVMAEWLETADREGWPPLGGLTFAMNATGFEAVVARARHDLNVSRGCDMPGAVAWRRAHPEWRPDQGGDAAIAFELELSDEADRLYAAWFDHNNQ